MASPIDPDELALVVAAISCGTTGCCEWDSAAAERFRRKPPIPGLTPEGDSKLLEASVVAGHPVIQVVEEREYWKNRRDFNRIYYKVILPISGLIRGLFVEIVLTDDDRELPSVMIVNAHEQQP
ncbi:MAG TPA: hypothetical protein VGL71_01660 [Urbifossiella sp.]